MDDDQLNPVDLNLINDLWVPNVFIYNLKTFKVGTKQAPLEITNMYRVIHHVLPLVLLTCEQRLRFSIFSLY